MLLIRLLLHAERARTKKYPVDRLIFVCGLAHESEIAYFLNYPEELMNYLKAPYYFRPRQLNQPVLGNVGVTGEQLEYFARVWGSGLLY